MSQPKDLVCLEDLLSPANGAGGGLTESTKASDGGIRSGGIVGEI